MTWREHFEKNRVAYIAAGTGIAAGLAGASLGWGIGADPAGVFGTGVKHWGASPQPGGSVSLPSIGIHDGPNPFARDAPRWYEMEDMRRVPQMRDNGNNARVTPTRDNGNNGVFLTGRAELNGINERPNARPAAQATANFRGTGWGQMGTPTVLPFARRPRP